MTDSTLSRDMALRIALAARVLHEPDPARILRVLEDAVGLPPNPKRLNRLTPDALKGAAGGELADLEPERLQQVLDHLQGQAPVLGDELPEVEPYAEGQMPGSIRVACASNDGEQLDGHFGSCRRFLVYQVSADEARLVDVRLPEEGQAAEEKNALRAQAIADCQLVYVMSIGGPAAAKVVKAGVHPIKVPAGGAAREQVARLGAVLADAPPPWLAKVIGQAPEQRVRFEQAVES
jgi:nitrogen fixation protein NifX